MHSDAAPAIAVATMTLARTAAEEALLEKSLRELAHRGWPVALTDGGSADAFLSRLLSIPGVRVQRAVGLVPQITAGITGALRSGASSVLYTEPDKMAFFAEHIEDFVRRSRLVAPDAVGLAARSAAAFNTYPQHQQTTESIINERCGETFGLAGDYSYGPFVIPRQLAARLVAVPARLGWGWRHFAFAVAHRLGYPLAMVEGPYECPPDQRYEDDADRAHRDRQLRDNLEGLSLGMATRLSRRSPVA
jgi:hypothetical protein